MFTIILALCHAGVDPYALIKCGGKTVRTPTAKDTRNPEWNSGALFYVRRPKKTHLVVQVSLKYSDPLRREADSNFRRGNVYNCQKKVSVSHRNHAIKRFTDNSVTSGPADELTNRIAGTIQVGGGIGARWAR